jgi:uncharacterized membrane protein YqjE
VLTSLRTVLASVPDIAATRLQLATVELEEQRLYLAQLCLLALAFVLVTGITLLLGAVLILALFWDGPRVLVMGLLTLVFLLGAAALAWRWRITQRRRPALLANTLAQLKADRDTLLGAGRLK